MSNVFAHFRNTDFLKTRPLASINDGKYTWNSNGDEVTHTFACNHEQEGRRMVFHASLSSEDAVVVAADTDALILIIYADSQYMVKRF